MNDQQSTSPAVSPVLPIITSIIWAIVWIIVSMMSLFTVMAFDSGSVTLSMGMLVAGIWMVVFLCPLSIIGGWIAWAVTRHRPAGTSRGVRGALYALPLVGILTCGIATVIGTVIG